MFFFTLQLYTEKFIYKKKKQLNIMKKIFTMLLVVFIATLNVYSQEHIVKFTVSTKKELLKLPKYVSVDNYKDNVVTAYLWGENFDKFKQLGYNFTEIQKAEPKVLNMATTVGEMANWDRYPTYSVYVQMMQNFAANYPNICKLDTIGISQNGHLILVVRITDNVNTDEAEPEFFYTSTMHGDETTGIVLMLRLINYLLSNYGSDSEVNNLVNNYDIWINPLANPDGTYHGGDNTVSGSQRELANGDDPNRDFPYPLDITHTTNNPETIAMMDFATEHNFVMSANFHGGSEVYNYPWDCWTSAENTPADNDWFSHLGENYVTSARTTNSSYMTSVTSSGVTEGADWYYAFGSRQDYYNYFHHCKEVTVELSDEKTLSSDQLPTYWIYNKQSLLDYMKEALYGFNGTVTNTNGEPLDATIRIIDYDKDNSWVTTDPKTGDYYRPIAPGTYQVKYSADGYISKLIDVTVSDWETRTIQNVVLESSSVVTLSGTVIDASTGSPLQNVKIDFTNTSITPVYTNANGHYQININADIYDISAYLDGYSKQSKMKTVSDTNKIVDFALLPSDAITFESEIPGDFENSGDAYWYRDNTVAYEGAYSLKSGDISDNQNTTVQFTRTVSSGTFSFYYKVSSEQNYDFLKFYIDGVEKGSWSDEIDWTQASFTVSAGSHTFKWEYTKDESQSEGSDCAWIDNIEIPSSTTYNQYNVTFTVLEDTTSNPVENAIVNLKGYGTVHTNSQGIAQFSDVYETSGTNTLQYDVYADGYAVATGNTIVNGDKDITVYLEDSVVNIKEVTDNINIYPNPVRDILKINSNSEVSAVLLMDLSGNIIYQTHTKQIDISNLSQGIYLIKIFTPQKVITKKIVKI